MQNDTQNDMEIDDFRISTWRSDHTEPPYLAINMTAAIETLKGYPLTNDEKTKMSFLMAGYCRLIDEAGLAGYGKTEFESIQDLFSNATLN